MTWPRVCGRVAENGEYATGGVVRRLRPLGRVAGIECRWPGFTADGWRKYWPDEPTDDVPART